MQDNNAVCRNVQTLLSDYVDSALPARQMFEVEKHLTDCPECAALSRQMETTVRLLHAASRYDTADDFMAKLHARLDGLEPEPFSARNGWDRVRAWLHNMRETLSAQRVPALGLGTAVLALVGIVAFNRVGIVALNRPAVPIVSGPPAPPPVNVGEPLQRNVALAAGNPFDDPVAANLEAHSALKEVSAASETEAAF